MSLLCRCAIGVAAAALLAAAWQPALADPAAGPRYADGAATFQANCVVCHGHGGLGQPSLAPPLTGYPARYIASADGRRQLAMTVLDGMYGDVVVDRKHYNFKMPDFSRLSDDTLAAVLNYVVFDLAPLPPAAAPMSAAEIAAERASPASGEAVRQHRAALLPSLGL